MDRHHPPSYNLFFARSSSAPVCFCEHPHFLFKDADFFTDISFFVSVDLRGFRDIYIISAIQPGT